MIHDHATFELELHSEDCRCRACRPRRGPAREVDRLDAEAIGKLAVAGTAVGTAIAFAIDAHGAIAALKSVVGL